MKTVGIREAKARLSALARAASAGEITILSDYGKPIAVIAPMDASPTGQENGGSDAAQFRQALLALPHELSVDF